ncbi:hypothetical protein ACFLSF_01425 [Candidatus Bipolaricaulota bacterium]
MVCVAVLCGLAGFLVGCPCAAAQLDSGSKDQTAAGAEIPERLDVIIESILAIPAEMKLRRNLAHATFCLPQNLLGILLYGLLQAAGDVLHTQEMNEMTIVVTGVPIGASLGRYIFVPATFLTEAAVRHEYGHTMQGYRHGPFFLLFEGAASSIQAVIATVSPSFAKGYFDRWPENEATQLGGASSEDF